MTLERNHYDYKEIRKSRFERQEEILKNIFGVKEVRELRSADVVYLLGEEPREVSDGNGRRFKISAVELNGLPEFVATAYIVDPETNELRRTGESIYLPPLDQQTGHDVKVRVRQEGRDADDWTDIDMAADRYGWSDFIDISETAEKAEDFLKAA